MKPPAYPDTPRHLWDHFYAISRIPRPSKHEQRIRQYLVELAEQHDCQWQTDAIGNLLIRVPGNGGLEQRPPLIIQNHLDMVTVKTDDSDHDFNVDPLSLQVRDNWLCADRTTLGADNGLGCAAALALMTDAEVVHPPLELLFTLDEETGMGGALNIDTSLLSGRRMLNLDTEDWGELFIGCAGGRGWLFTRQLQRELAPVGERGLRLRLSGLAGGHSGLQIHQQLGNANKLLAQWLYEAAALGVRLSAFNGGVAHNVIPRSATVDFSCPRQQVVELERLNQRMQARWLSFLPAADRQLQLALEDCDIAEVFTRDAQAGLCQFLLALPHGAQSYNLSQPAELVDLSCNLALVKTEGAVLGVTASLRFFNEDEAQALMATVLSIAEGFQFAAESVLSYPGWKPDFDSGLLAQTRALYRQLFDEEAQVKAIHAGLECGILKSKMGEVDIISFGPTIRGAHSPAERLDISTVEPFWRLLTGLVRQL